MNRKVAIVTGTNSNLGLNIVFRLIETEEANVRLTIVVTSRTLPRVKEVINQIKDFYTNKSKRVGDLEIDFDYLLVDFTNMVSVLNAYYDINKKYDAINYLFVNAAQGIFDGIDWFSAVKEVLVSPLDAVTNPTYKIQLVGVKSKDDMGLVFQANVFGPYYFISKIMPQLAKGKAYIVWISSIMSHPKYLSLNDIELIKSDASYEGSKRLVDLLHLATYKDLKKQGINQYVVQPGIFTSQSFSKYLNFFTYFGMLFLFYLARWFGSPWHNIDGYKAANAPVYVTRLANPNFEKQDVKYGSATSRDGMPYIKTQEIDPTGMSDAFAYIEKKKLEWDEKLKHQIVETRVPI
ncbi:erg27p [Saccharomyces arboricola H-6]|uniref:3beta-hydroxysteroid 3-dehydrogenase n=1 Tax=Saccharomyces arboricola (strain H-6 / AS 2.3317 / CBS 10644) TaxID=1160507 RepID=J8LL00_SACAR|nr:erg27p [Saccharomyces arboricola H-6]